MPKLESVEIEAAPLDRFQPLIGDRYEQIEAAAATARRAFGERRIWHVNSTAQGGGVAEMLRALLPYVRGAGVDTRWLVLPETDGFFGVTKRIHNRLHGHEGEGGPLDDRARETYERALARSAEELGRLVDPSDVVYLHDPQTAGLVPAMRSAGAAVVWRCHVGVDRPNDFAREAWDFLRPYVEAADAYVFSRQEYLWEGLDPEKAWFMPPVIDPFSPKTKTSIGRRSGRSWRRSRPRRRSCGRGRCPRAPASSPRSPAGIDSRTRRGCWRSSSATSTIPRCTSSWSGPTRRASATTPREPRSTKRWPSSGAG